MDKIEKNTLPENLKKKIKEEYKIWKEYFEKYLSYKKENDKYILEKKSNDKVHIRSIFSMLQNLYSIFVIDEKKVSFIPTAISGENVVDIYNKLAEFDYKMMNKRAFDFIKVYYWFIYGIWATRIASWDNENNIPILESVNTMWLILDPDEITKWSKRRFIWVNKKITVENLKKINWITNITNILEKKETDEIDIYHHYTRYNDEVYLTTWLWESCDKLIKVEKFSKKSWIYDTFWFSIFIPWNVWNWQLWDLIELWAEYQKMMSQITNLMLIQARKDVLWEDRLININKIDIEFLSSWAPWWRNIPVELEEWEVLNNVLMQIPKEQPSQQANQWLQLLENLKQEATWISPITQGQVSDQRMTKWEVQILQANANMKFSLVMSYLIQSDIEFWLTWQAFYREYFDWTKNIFLDKYKSVYKTITRKDLWTSDIIWAVKIEATSEINRIKREKYQKMLSIMPNIMPMMSEENQKEFTRKLMELSGFEKEETIAYLPESKDEIQAKIDLERLNNWLDPSEPELWQKHEIFERIFNQAIPSKKVAKAIAQRRLLRVTENQEAIQNVPQEEWNFNNMQNISQAQTMSKILNEDNWQNIISNQDILW